MDIGIRKFKTPEISQRSAIGLPLATFAATLLLMSACALAVAQDTSAKDQDASQSTTQKDKAQGDKKGSQKDGQAKKGDEKSTGDTSEGKPETNGPSLNLGVSTWGLSGNEHKFRQYASPPKGLFLGSLFYAPYTDNLRYDAFFHLQTPWDDDYRLTGGVRLNYGNTVLTATNYRNRFFDPTDFVIDSSERQASEAYFRQNLTRTLALILGAKEDQQDQNFEAPKDALHQRTRTWEGKIQGALSDRDYASIGFADWHFFDRTEIEPDSHLSQWNVNYLHEFHPNIAIQGSFSDSQIEQPNLSDSHVQAWGAGGSWDLGDTTSLFLNWRGERLSLPNVGDAYDRARSQTSARLLQSWRNWTAEIAYNQLNIERVRADHTFVDDPAFHTVSGRLSGRLTPWARFTASASRETLQGSAEMETDDPLALYWRNIWRAQAKLDAFTDNLDGYVIYSYMDENNDPRATSVHSRILTYGGSWQARPDLTLYFESTNDWWSANSGDPQAASLGLFFPNASVFAVGANWNVNTVLSATANYSQFWTDNANPLYLAGGNVRGKFLTTGLTYRFVNGDEVGVIFAPWHYTDLADSNQNYETALFTLTARLKF